MRQYLPSIGGAIVSIIGIALGLVPLFGTWPGWLLVGVGVVGLVGVALQAVRTSRRSDQASGTSVRQKQRSGANSRNVQAGGNVRIDGGLGDQK